MTATAAQIGKLRRMIAEPTHSTYVDADLKGYIESYPLADSDGNEPGSDEWTARYDLNAAASDLWAEKAAVVAQDYSFSADGGSHTRNQVYEQYMKQSRFYGSRRAMGSVKVHVEPKPIAALTWVGNLPEDD